MLTDRSEINRVSADPATVTEPWWQGRRNPCSHKWSRHAVEARITMSASHAQALSTAGPLCDAPAELRWRRFLLIVHRLTERPARRGLN